MAADKRLVLALLNNPVMIDRHTVRAYRTAVGALAAYIVADLCPALGESVVAGLEADVVPNHPGLGILGLESLVPPVVEYYVPRVVGLWSRVRLGIAVANVSAVFDC